MSRHTATSSRLRARLVLGVCLGLLTRDLLARPILGTALSRGQRVLLSSATVDAPPLEGTYWKAIELAGRSVSSPNPAREAHLILETGGHLSGADGCNTISGSYEREDDRITFGQTIATRMACPNTADVEQGFRNALRSAAHWRITNNRLELYDAASVLLAVFEARAAASA